MKQIKRMLVKEVSKYKNVPQYIVKKVIDGFVEKIIDAIFKGDDVEIRNFGTIKAKTTKPRRVHAFGKYDMTLPEKKKPVIKFSKNVWKKLNPDAKPKTNPKPDKPGHPDQPDDNLDL